jgi:hypothetical protein
MIMVKPFVSVIFIYTAVSLLNCTGRLSCCGHVFCWSCILAWFEVTLDKFVAIHPDFNLHPCLLIVMCQLVNDWGNWADDHNSCVLIDQQLALFRHGQPCYMCPSCRATVKSNPIPIFMLHDIGHALSITTFTDIRVVVCGASGLTGDGSQDSKTFDKFFWGLTSHVRWCHEVCLVCKVRLQVWLLWYLLQTNQLPVF